MTNLPLWAYHIYTFLCQHKVSHKKEKTHALFCNLHKFSFSHSMGHLSITITLISFIFLTHYHQLVHAESPTQPPYSCDISNPLTKSYAFCNLKLPIIERAKDIVSRLTLDEKLAQLVNTAPSIPRLGIPSYQWWSEALHGVANAGKGIRLNGTIKAATSFPQVILTAASFDSKLWYQISKVSLLLYYLLIVLIKREFYGIILHRDFDSTGWIFVKFIKTWVLLRKHQFHFIFEIVEK